MIRIDELDHTKNFWSEYPHVKSFPEFHNLWKKDRDRHKTKSSTLMWAFAFIYYPINNPYYNVPDKKNVIAINILKDHKFDWSMYSKEMRLFEQSCTTEAERSLVKWEEKMSDRSDFMDGKKYEESSYKMLDDMMSKTPKMYEDLANIKKRIEEQRITKRKSSDNMNSDNDF